MAHTAVAHGFAAVGDIMLGDSSVCVGFGFHSTYPRDASAAFGRVRGTLERHEIVIGNLECLLTPNGAGANRFRADQMRGDPQYAVSLRQAGFTALSVANNHAMQHGRAAFDLTVAALTNAGIAVIGLAGEDGWCAKPAIIRTRDGRGVGILGYSWRPQQYGSGVPPYARGDVADVERDVRRLAAMTDDVVVSLHWGEEFVDRPSREEVEHGRRIIDAGARIIVGHHPHVRRPVERYNGGLICYSLGNFVTDMTWQQQLRDGLLLSCELDGGPPRDVTIFSTRVSRHYVPEIIGPIADAPTTSIESLAAPAYRVAVQHTVRQQQLASYSHAARNAFRFPITVLVTLAASTLRNKLAALSMRIRRASTTGQG